jgi:hypothetical protein
LDKGTIVNWLRRKNISEKADRIERLIVDGSPDLFKVYTILFDCEGLDFDDFIADAKNNCDDNMLQFAADYIVNRPEIIGGLSVKNFLPGEDWFFVTERNNNAVIRKIREFATTYVNEKDTALVFNAGKYLYESNIDARLGTNCINEAVRRRYSEAMAYWEDNLSMENLYKLFDDKEVKNRLIQSWKNGDFIPIRGCRTINDTLINEIYRFSNACMELRRTLAGNGGCKCEEFEQKTLTTKLVKERFFVMALAKLDKEEAKKILSKIEGYPPADDLYNGEVVSFRYGVRGSYTRFNLGKPYENLKDIQFYVKNLHKFAGYEK